MAMSSEGVSAAPALPALTCSTATTAEAEPLSAERIEELIDWTEQLFETDPELKETVTQDQIDRIMDSLKAELN